MKLITDAEFRKIRSALHDVTDTFFVTPIIYRMSIESIDRFNEDREDTVYHDYNLLSMVEYNTFDRNRDKGHITGKEDRSEIKVSFNYDDLEAAGLTNPLTNGVIFNGQKDKIIVRGILYHVVQVNYDGPLEDRNVLIVVYASPNPQTT
jgi:hypothetical protein